MSHKPSAQRLMIQRQVLQCLWDGLTIKQIANYLGLTVSPVCRRIRQMMQSSVVETHVGLVRRALEEGLIRP